MKQGDFIQIDYVGRVKATNEIFDLTSEDLAKKEKVHNPKQRYGPALVIVGSRMVIPGFMRRLEFMKVGEEKEFDVDPKEAFGFRNPKLIRIIPISKFYENKINPLPGTFVEIDGINAKIQSVSGGRVRVDFNNPLAGRELHYKVKILRKITGEKNQIGKLLDYYRIEYDEINLLKDKTVIKLKIKINPAVEKLFKGMLTKWVKSIRKVEFKTGKMKPAEEIEVSKKL